MSRAESRDNDFITKFPGLEITQQAKNDSVLRPVDPRLHPLPENRFVGSNAGHYVNPEPDRIIDQLQSTLDRNEQGRVLREAGEVLAADLPQALAAVLLHHHVAAPAEVDAPVGRRRAGLRLAASRTPHRLTTRPPWLPSTSRLPLRPA